jgi:hypothetical protein
MNPRIAGEPGAAMANAAEQMGDVAQQGYQFAEKLRQARNVVDVQKGEIGIGLLEKQAQEALKTAGTDEQKQAIQQGFQEQAQEHIAQYKDPKVGEALRLYSASKSADLQGLVLTKKADDLIKDAKATNILTGEKNSQEYVQAAASHLDTSLVEGKEELWLASLVHTAVLTEGEAKLEYDDWLRKAKLGTISALANSPNPAERQGIIAMLGPDGKGPLVDGMDLAQRNNALKAAKDADREQNNLAKAQNLNGVLNKMHEEFKPFPYTKADGNGDYEARINAAENDDDFARRIGAVMPDGSINREMLEKEVVPEINRQRAEWEKEQSDKDQNIIAKHIPNVMKMSEAQVTALGSEGLSPRGISALEMERKRQIAEIRSSNLQERALARQEATEDSYELVARLGSQPGYLTRNDIPDLMKNNPKMKYSDALHVVEMRSAQADPNFQSAMKIFEDAANQGAMTLSDVGEANIAMLKRAKEGVTGTDLMKFASETVRPHVEKDIKNRLDQIVYPQLAMPTAAPGTAQPGFFSRIGTWAENQVITNAFPTTMKSYAKQESAARQAPDAAAPAKSTRPSGATGTAKGKDGKLHWADASGNDYGVAQ